MALAINRNGLLFPLPLHPSDEKFLVQFILDYLELFEKRKTNKIFAKLFKEKDLYRLLKILHEVSKYDTSFIAPLKIITDLYNSLYGKHGHFNEKRLEMYLKQLYSEFLQIKNKLFMIQKI